MPNQRKATFMVSSIPKSAMNAGKKAVRGIERMGAAIGFTRSNTHRKLPIKIPSGTAITVHHTNAWAILHQLAATFARRSFSVQSLPNACNTAKGRGSANGGRISQCVSANQSSTIVLQLTIPKISLVRGETSLRIVKRSDINLKGRDSRKA